MSMSKKDFIGIAANLHRVKPIPIATDTLDESRYEDGLYRGWLEAVKAVASYCMDANPNFRRDQFLEACKNG